MALAGGGEVEHTSGGVFQGKILRELAFHRAAEVTKLWSSWRKHRTRPIDTRLA